MTKNVKKAIFPVGGLGTRFLPATKSMPKEMLPILDKPLIQYAFEEAKAAGIEEFIFVTGRNKGIIEDYFDHSYELQHVLETKGKTDELEELQSWLPEPGQVVFTRQQEPLGLGHAVYCARNMIGDEPFAVLLADEMLVSEPPFLKQMVQAYEKTGGNIVAVSSVDKDKVQNYGIIDTKGENDGLLEINGMIEKPSPENAPSNMAIIGRYILQPDVFDFLSEGKKGSGGEIQLTDAMILTLAISPFYGLEFNGSRFDCGSKTGFLEATIAMGLEHKEISEFAENILKKYSRKF